MQVLLIDLENCPSQTSKLLENLADYSQVIICYAQSGAKIPIDWVIPLTKSVNDNTLKIIKMPAVKKNAADFGITFWAGALMAQLPEKTHFDIVSNDTDLDIAIDLLTSQLRSAKRIGIIKKQTEVFPTPTAQPISDASQDYCLHLNSHSNKPAKKTTLLNSITSKFKSDASINPASVLHELTQHGIVITYNDSDKITYNIQKLHSLKTK